MRAAPVLLSVVVTACGPNAMTSDDDGIVDDDGDGPDDPGDTPPDELPVGPCSKMDILFVIDNSGSMGDEQENLRDNFPHFIDVLDTHVTSAGELIDYRVAVTTTSRDVDYFWSNWVPPGDPPSLTPQHQDGDDGELLQKCGMNQRWLSRGDSFLAGTFSCLADVGTGGSSLEMPLYVSELALGDRVADGTNADFFRDDALLAIVMLTDEEDCSRSDDGFTITTDECKAGESGLVPPSDSIAFLDNVTGARGRWAAAVVAGPGPGTCNSNFGSALDAQRLRQFVDETGPSAVFSSICDGDLTPALSAALDTFMAACETFPPVL